jgi:glycosyltransferase involved in cell wall biosynthesis
VQLILLWRGLLLDQLRERVARRGIDDRVEIVPERVEIDDYLKRANAVVLAAKRSDIVKAYPHSLLESLAAGRPVILSAALPMADFVREHRCGIVVDNVTSRSLIWSVQELRSGYANLVRGAQSIDFSLFSRANMLAAYRPIYSSAGFGHR